MPIVNVEPETSHHSGDRGPRAARARRRIAHRPLSAVRRSYCAASRSGVGLTPTRYKARASPKWIRLHADLPFSSGRRPVAAGSSQLWQCHRPRPARAGHVAMISRRDARPAASVMFRLAFGCFRAHTGRRWRSLYMTRKPRQRLACKAYMYRSPITAVTSACGGHELACSMPNNTVPLSECILPLGEPSQGSDDGCSIASGSSASSLLSGCSMMSSKPLMKLKLGVVHVEGSRQRKKRSARKKRKPSPSRKNRDDIPVFDAAIARQQRHAARSHYGPPSCEKYVVPHQRPRPVSRRCLQRRTAARQRRRS